MGNALESAAVLAQTRFNPWGTFGVDVIGGWIQSRLDKKRAKKREESLAAVSASQQRYRDNPELLDQAINNMLSMPKYYGMSREDAANILTGASSSGGSSSSFPSMGSFSSHPHKSQASPAGASSGLSTLNGVSQITRNAPSSKYEKIGTTYGWQVVETLAKIGDLISVVYGEYKVKVIPINQYVDTDGYKNYLNCICVICEGEIDSISDIRINGNPLESFENVLTYERMGTLRQDKIPNFELEHSVEDVGATLARNTAYEYTTTKAVEALDLIFYFREGIKDPHDDGTIHPWHLNYLVEYKKTTDTEWQTIEHRQSIERKGSWHHHKKVFDLESAYYDIRVTNQIPLATDDYENIMMLEGVNEMLVGDLYYSNTALLGFRALADEQVNNKTPEITCVVKGRKVLSPRILKDNDGVLEVVSYEDFYFDSDTSTYKLFSDDSELIFDGAYHCVWSANPAWCIRDFQTNKRFGLGDLISSNDPGLIASNVALQLNFEGNNGDTSTVDESPNNVTVNFGGNAQLTTSDKKFGNSSLLFDDYYAYLSLELIHDYDLLRDMKSVFTAEFWVKHNNPSGDDNIQYYFSGGVSATRFHLYAHKSKNSIVFYAKQNYVDMIVLRCNTMITDSEWHLIRVIIIDKFIGIYLDENQIGFAINDIQIPIADQAGAKLYIGSALGYGYNFNGKLDSFRIHKTNIHHAMPNAGLSDTIEVPTTAPSIPDLEENLDINSIVEAGKYCDEKIADGEGGFEKRFRLDMLINGDVDGWSTIESMAKQFRAFVHSSNGKNKLIVDRPREASYIFGMGNIIEGSFSINYEAASEKINWAEIYFLNKEKGYVEDCFIIRDNDDIQATGIVKKQQVKVFTTSKSQAYRHGLYFINLQKHSRFSVSFAGGIDSCCIEPADVILMNHDVPSWGISGRVSSSSGNTFTPDSPVELIPGVTYYVQFKHSDDSISDWYEIASSVGVHEELSINGVFDPLPKSFDLYQLAADKTTKPLMITMTGLQENGEALFSAVEYSDSIHDTNIVKLPTDNSSLLTVGIPQVTELSLSESLIKKGDGTIESTIDVNYVLPFIHSYNTYSFEKVRIYLSKDDGESWLLQGETNGDYYKVNKNLVDGKSYRIAVVSVSKNGIQSPINTSPQASRFLLGKSADPADVVGFAAKIDGTEIVCSWSPIPDVDLKGYEIREGVDWQSGTLIDKGIVGTFYRVPIYKNGEVRLMIKALDTSGNYSKNEAYSVVEILNVVGIEFKEETDLSNWDDCTLSGTNAPVNITDSLGEILVDSNDEEIVESLVGFERKTQASDGEPIVDSEGNQVTKEDGEPVYTSGVRPEFLELRNYSDGTYAENGVCVYKPIDIGQVIKGKISVTPNVEIQNGTYNIQVRTSLDGTIWSDWENQSPGEYTFRYYQPKIEINTNDPLKWGRLYSWKSQVVVRYREESGTLSVDETGQGTIVFQNDYYEKVVVIPIAEGANYVRKGTKIISGGKITGINVEVRKDSDSSLTSGDVDYTVKGY